MNLSDIGGPLHIPPATNATKEILDGSGSVGLGRGSVGRLRADIVRKNSHIGPIEAIGSIPGTSTIF